MTSQAPSLRLLTPLASLLLAVAAAAWVGVVVLARDMGSMPGTMGLGVGSFIAVWALMMAAMMLPSVTPFASLYTRTFGDDRGWRLAGFASGYLVVWIAAALPAYGLAWLADRLAGVRPAAATVLAVAIFAEDLWAPPLLAGSTIAEVGNRFDGDVLGADPRAAWSAASAGAVRAVGEHGAMDRIVHLSFGDVPGREYTLQLFADHLIHAWDLARAIGTDEHLDAGLVASCATWFQTMEDGYRSAGAIAARPPVPDDADAQTVLLARFGRYA